MSTPNPAYVRTIQFLIEHKACSGFLSCWSAADPAIKAVIAEVWGGDPWPQTSEPTPSTTTTTATDPRLGHGVPARKVTPAILCGSTCEHEHNSLNGPTGCCAEHGPYLYYCDPCHETWRARQEAGDQ